MWRPMVQLIVAEFPKLSETQHVLRGNGCTDLYSILGQSVFFIVGLERWKKATVLVRQLAELDVSTGDDFEL
jgi:hypothetical protein